MPDRDDAASSASSRRERERPMNGFPTYDPVREPPRSSGPRRSDSGSPPDDTDLESRVPRPDLRRALARVLEGWRENTPDEERGREAELTDRLIEIAEATIEALDGPPASVRDPDGLALQQRLLGLLRRELIAVWAEEDGLLPDDPSDVVEILEGFERIQEGLSPRWDERFGVELSGPSGVELAVEVAHDFRSPLSSILFLADTLKTGGSGELNELQRRQLNLIYSAALSMVSMAGDVVDLGRDRQQDLADREPSQFSVAEVMTSVRSMVEPMVEAKGLSLAVRPPEGDTRLGHPEALRRVLLNLTTNAVKFTSDGFIEMTAETRGPTRVRFSVRDTGPGIRAKARDDLYQAFRPFQGRSGFHFSGTGLGLIIARKMVRGMDGELRYETKKNLGTRFYFTIPLMPVDPY